MARLERLRKSEVAGDVRTLYEDVGSKRGNVPNMFRVYDALQMQPTKPGEGLE